MLPLCKAPDRLCILRLSALGDVVHVVPVIQAIRSHWPQTRLTWIIGKLEHRLLHSLEGVEFIVFDKRGGIGSIRNLSRQLKGRSFDVLLHMQVALRANILSRLIKAPIRLGWDRARSRDRHHWFINHQVRSVPFQHQVQGFLEFARALGIQVDTPVWRLPVDAQDRAWVRQQVPSQKPLLIISPCSSHRLRNWPAHRYAEIADLAVQRLGMNVVLTGGPGKLEMEAAADIEASMRSTVTNLVGKDTLGQSMALLQAATVLISPDSGPAHIASALGTPVIGLYAATWSKRSGPYNSLELCVDRFEEAAHKYRGKKPEELRWGTRIEVDGVMELVTVSDVFQKLQQVAKDF